MGAKKESYANEYVTEYQINLRCLQLLLSLANPRSLALTAFRVAIILCALYFLLCHLDVRRLEIGYCAAQ